MLTATAVLSTLYRTVHNTVVELDFEITKFEAAHDFELGCSGVFPLMSSLGPLASLGLGPKPSTTTSTPSVNFDDDFDALLAGASKSDGCN